MVIERIKKYEYLGGSFDNSSRSNGDVERARGHKQAAQAHRERAATRGSGRVGRFRRGIDLSHAQHRDNAVLGEVLGFGWRTVSRLLRRTGPA